MVDSIGQRPVIINAKTGEPISKEDYEKLSQIRLGPGGLHPDAVKKFGEKTLTADVLQFGNSTVDTKAKHNQTIHDAKVAASGWSAILGFLPAIYYAARSDESVAKKYNLDVQVDKDKIKEIKSTQIKLSLCTVLPGLGFIPLAYFGLIEDPQDQKIFKPKAA